MRSSCRDQGNAIVIGDEELSAAHVLSTEPLFGFRKVSGEVFKVTGAAKEKVGIPVNVFVESAKAMPRIKDKVIKAGKDPSSATLDDWYRASESVPLTTAKMVKPMGMKVRLSAERQITVDPHLIVSLPKTEVFKSGRPESYVIDADREKVELIKADPEAYQTFANCYTVLAKAAKLSPPKARQSFNYVSANMDSHPHLKEAAMFHGGEVTFGKPTVFSSEEKRLDLPESIIANADVYWIEFAVSFRDVEICNIEKLIFTVSADEGISALQLIPLRFDKEISKTITTSSPELKTRYVAVGKVYGQEVVYKSLKPIIIADGLQESDFSWTLMDEAVQPGAKRFIAVLQVPKGKKLLMLNIQAGAKTKPGWVAQGNIISTKAKLVNIKLK